MHNGELAPDILVCHKCDNRACVNPSHLFLGTHLDNLRDAAIKGRTLTGEKNNRAKLTNEKVLCIRQLLASGRSAHSIAPEFGVTDRVILLIKRRETWKHI